MKWFLGSELYLYEGFANVHVSSSKDPAITLFICPVPQDSVVRALSSQNT